MKFEFTEMSKEEYKRERYHFILMTEESGVPSLRPYNDGKGLVTIGIGFNLQVETNRKAVLDALGFKEPQLVKDQEDYLKEVLKPKNKTNDRVQKELNAIVNRHLPGEKFQFNSKEQVEVLFNGDKHREGLVEYYEEGVDDWSLKKGLGRIPLSRERLALLSLHYNGILRDCHNLAQAIQGSDRPKAWLEIRYLSNSGSLLYDPSQKMPAGFICHGIAKRRFYEAEMFGLYGDTSTLTPEQKEAQRRLVAKRLEPYRPLIDKYEALYGQTIDGKIGAQPMIAQANEHYHLTGTPFKITLISEIFGSENEVVVAKSTQGTSTATQASQTNSTTASSHTAPGTSIKSPVGVEKAKVQSSEKPPQPHRGNPSRQGSGGGNVLINGRTAVHAGSGGTLTTVDVCRTQIGPAVVNIPYTNIAKSSDAANTAATVFINGHPVCTKNSCFAKSTGDEAGNRQGLHSGTIMGKADFITASPNVYIEGIAAVRNGDLMVSNNRNTAPMPLVQPTASPAPAKALALVDALDKPGTPFKLALEIAGTQSLNMKGTLIARNGDSTHEVPLGSTAHTDGHRRELIFENLAEGEYDLFLYQPDEKHGAYQIPLVQGFSTCSSEESSPRWQTVLVPLLPRCYTTTDADRTKAQYPRSSQDLGWLYVFVNGRLWRELKVEREGFFRDVNLTYEKGQDVRPATVQTSDSRVVVPCTIQGKAVALEMAYSEVQWSWARIDAMGGMAGNDFKEAAKLRSRRMQKIDLSSYPDFNQEEGVIGPADQFEPPLRYDLAIHRESKIPVVYLHDPIGIAKDLATEVFVCKQNYLEGRDQAAEEAGTKNAMAEIVFQMGLDSQEAADLVDMDELREIVQWDRQIEHIRALEDAAVVLGQFITSAPVEGCPDIHTVMKDYDEHPHVELLLQGHLLSSELVGHLIYGEGRQYLSTSLRQPDHFLVSALSPCPRKIEALGKNIDKAAEFFENMAAAAQIDTELEKKVFEFFAKIIEQFSDGEYTLAHGNFDLAPVLAGSAAAAARGGYLSNSFTAVLRGRFDAAQWVVIKKGMSSQMALTLGRSVEWLQKNQPLIKLNAVRFFAVLEVMNLGKAVRGMKDGQSGTQETRAYAAIFSLISLGYTYLKEVKQIGAGWDNKELPRWQQQLLTKKRIAVAGGAHVFGFVANVIVVAQAWNDAWAEYKVGNTSGAVAAGVSALGSTILAAATTLGGVVEMNTLGASGFRGTQATRAARFGKTKVPLGRSLQASRVGAGTAAGLAIMLVGGALMFFFSRTPLEHFLVRGPFGRDKENRYKGSREFESWRDDAIAEATLFNILFSPRLDPRIRRLGFTGHMIELRIRLPLIFEGKTRIDYTLFGLSPLRFGKPAEKKVILPRDEGELISNEDGSYTLTLAYNFEAIRDFATYEAQAMVDLYGDGSRVLPVKIEHTALAGPDPVVVHFPEAVLS